jgi:integrase
MQGLKLTKTTVEKLPFEEDGQKLYHDTEIKGFGVRVSHKSKTYFAQRDVNGRTVRVTIGRHGIFTAEMAREEARKVIVDMVKGVNPNAEKKKQRLDKVTLQEAIDTYCKNKKNKLKKRTLDDYKRGAERYLAAWLNKPISEITKQMILIRHAQLAEEISEATANGTMRIFSAIYNHNLAFDDNLPSNPVVHLGRTRAWFKSKRRRSFIKTHQLKAWYEAVLQLENKTFRDYFLLLLFTGMRRSEAAKLKWADIDLKEKTMTLWETKNGEVLVLPMSIYVHDLLTRRNESKKYDDIYVFTSCKNKNYINCPKPSIKTVIKISAIQFMCHDLRRTFITIAESLDISAYALKYLLNHKTTSDITGGYIVLTPERMREPMEKISNKILEHIQTP